MTRVLKSIHQAELRVSTVTARFFLHHMFLGWLAVYIGMPIFVLTAVAACSTALILPFALLFGWL